MDGIKNAHAHIIFGWSKLMDIIIIIKYPPLKK